MCDDCSHHAHPNGKRLISVCGKGGAGKTVFTAMMTRALIESGRAGKLLVIDADPALGQLSALGSGVRRTMGQVREDIIRTARAGNKEAKAELAEKLDYLVFEALTETENFAAARRLSVVIAPSTACCAMRSRSSPRVSTRSSSTERPASSKSIGRLPVTWTIY
jgi:hypothetical protein